MFVQSGQWSHVSQQAKDLVTDMLHIAPQRRPTAAQLVKHPWLNRISSSCSSSHTQPQYIHHNNPQNISTNTVTLMDTSTSQPPSEGKHLKETVAATFRAIATSPQIAHLGPVAMSELARRRFKGRVKQS